ncbi:primosomal protein N' (replication factor Y) [Lactobacillus colini]|uniref:Replication restart protein PriA n=1 Tax=Lactobacillus colini TaxID=1819254 RepID=A0ABS4MC13_9LACO|nr:primosomal protein N' [Lactobacillus colini]MBP2056929.1 primosomal protein N' (replication factor Y) [Lactobacillus colini]
MIAQVIVDVASKQTDRIFEYNIPSQLDDVAIGSRVVVPFGRRKVQGFVVGLSKTTSFQGKLKDLLLVVDEMPPLTPELVKLSEKMAQDIFSYRITILQSMLPQVMRANYRKILAPIDDEAKQMPYFQGEPIDLNKVTDLKEIVFIKKLLRQNKAKVEYIVENKAHKKTEAVFYLAKEKNEFIEIYENLRKSAKKQQILLLDILNDYNAYPKRGKQLQEELNISSAVLKNAIEKGWLLKKEIEVYRNPLQHLKSDFHKKITLNHDQQSAFDEIKSAINQNKSKTFLLEGITGSGKTEVYLHAIQETLNSNRTALMLVPEISLTPQMVRQVKERFGSSVAVLHSALSAGEKYDEWRRIRRKEAQVVVGARSAIFAPLDNIGLIVIDEEHESSYKQEDNPRYHARDVAILRSKFHNCPLVLGSATPSLASRARAQKGLYELLKLNERANKKSLPEVNLIDLKHVEFAGGQFDLSVELVEAIKAKIAKKEQVILLLNRRGFASFMLCRDCGFVLKCPNCDISLTFHKDTQQMQCHYCGHTESIPRVCPRCNSRKIRFLGTGTQKVQEEITELVPQAKILRMDVDTTRKKGSYKRILDSFGRGDANILLGTQMIAKGLDFPNVTLVGVINADTSLQIPAYNASEKTFDLLTQVAGRAGRADKTGQVLIQTYNPEHYAIKLSQSQDYEAFYRHEMQVRYQGNYPPFFFTTLVSIASKNEQAAAKEAFLIKRKLMTKLHQPTIILGPTPSSITKIKNQYYYQILVKYKKEPHLNQILHEIQDDAQLAKKRGLNVYIDNEPEKII